MAQAQTGTACVDTATGPIGEAKRALTVSDLFDEIEVMARAVCRRRNAAKRHHRAIRKAGGQAGF